MPEYKKMRFAYGFDDVALVPGDVTVNPELTDVSFELDNIKFPLPIMASAMDSVVDPGFCILFNKIGGLAILNLDGVHTRYPDAGAMLQEIVQTPADKVTPLLQKIYSEPIKENLIGEIVTKIKKGGAICAVSTSLISPIIIISGSCLKIDLKHLAKVSPAFSFTCV